MKAKYHPAKPAGLAGTPKKLLLPVLAMAALALWCASAFSAQQQSQPLRCVAVRWPGKGVSPAGLERQLDIFREDGMKNLPEMTLWAEFPDQKILNNTDIEIVCGVTRLYGHGEDICTSVMLQGSFPARGDTRSCALSDQAAFDLFGSANAMGQTLQWNDQSYAVQGIFKNEQSLMLAQAGAGSEAEMANMQLRFADGGSRQQAEELLARTGFGGGALLLDLPLIAWGLQTLAALPALLLGGWILARLIARAWQKRKDPRRLLTDLPLLTPLAIASIYLSAIQLKLPAALVPSGWSDFSFWDALPKGWHDHLTQWLRHPASGDIALIFAVFGVFALIFLATLLGVLVCARTKIEKPAQLFFASGGSMALLFLMALHYKGLRISPAMWLLPCLWLLTDFALNRTRENTPSFGAARTQGSPCDSHHCYAWGKEKPDEKDAQ